MTEARLTMAVVRAAVAKAVVETSLRELADQVDMSWNGLNAFIKGGSPQKSTRLKLVRWYFTRAPIAVGCQSVARQNASSWSGFPGSHGRSRSGMG